MVATRLMTVEAFEALPLEGRWELIDGEMVEMPGSGGRASGVAVTTAVLLGNHVRETRAGRIFGADAGFVLFPDRPIVRVPDVSFVRAERLPDLDKEPGFLRLAPDLVVEVITPFDRAVEIAAKVEMYREAGVALIWLVDPAVRTVTVIRPGDVPLTLGSGDTLSGSPVLPGFSVLVDALFE